MRIHRRVTTSVIRLENPNLWASLGIGERKVYVGSLMIADRNANKLLRQQFYYPRFNFTHQRAEAHR